MRMYDIALASAVIDAPIKWTDNLLSQQVVPGVISARRGVTRHFSYPTLVRLAIIRQLHTNFGTSVSDAVRIADALSESHSHHYAAGQLRLTVDTAALEQALHQRLQDALESGPARKRGRPPKPGGK